MTTNDVIWRHTFLLTLVQGMLCRLLDAKPFSDPMQPYYHITTLRPRQNGRHFADDTFKCIFLNGGVWISIKLSLNFVLTGSINNIPALVQIMAWHRPGAKPSTEPMMFSLRTHTCVTGPQWVTNGSLGTDFRETGIKTFSFEKMTSKCHLPTVSHSVHMSIHWGWVTHICVSELCHFRFR